MIALIVSPSAEEWQYCAYLIRIYRCRGGARGRTQSSYFAHCTHTHTHFQGAIDACWLRSLRPLSCGGLLQCFPALWDSCGGQTAQTVLASLTKAVQTHSGQKSLRDLFSYKRGKWCKLYSTQYSTELLLDDLCILSVSWLCIELGGESTRISTILPSATASKTGWEGTI